MIGHYLKTGVRNLWRNKGYSFINIFGLAVAVACCLLITLFVKSEFSYDKFHSKHDLLYRVWQHEKYEGEDLINSITPLPMATALKNSYPEIESTCRVYAFNPQVKINNQAFNENVRMVDSTFFHMFDFGLIQCDIKKPFTNVNSVIITTEIAKKYFGSTNPIGSTIEIKLGKENVPFIISGLTEKGPEESSIKFNMLISYANSKYLFSERAHRSWFNVFNETYALLLPNTNVASLEKKFPALIKKSLGEDYKEDSFLLHLQPIHDIHLNVDIPVGNEPISNPKYAYILFSIGILLLLVACINFITLSIGRSTSRAMEVGVRKTLGAERKQIIKQFWGESFIVTLLAALIGFCIALSSLNAFNTIVDRQLFINPDVSLAAIIIVLITVIAFIAGIYPAIILSGFRPIEVLKGKIKLHGRSDWFQQSLIVGQFVASITLIIGTIVIARQLNFLKNKDLGYTKDQVVIVSTNKGIKEGEELANLYRNELTKYPNVTGISTALYSFAETPWVTLGITDAKNIYRTFQYNAVDADFLKLMKIRLKAGRSFSNEDPSDKLSAAVVNESFVKEFGIKDPIGKKLPGNFDQIIIGVTEDFNYESLHSNVKPLLLTMRVDSMGKRSENISYVIDLRPRISVKLKGDNLENNLALLEQSWKKIAPEQKFDYKFLDESIIAQYKVEEKSNDIIQLATVLSIVIACLGLFGLATLIVNKRTREIGIRKVLGATVMDLNAILTKNFLKLIIIAVVIASPVAWWLLQIWLDGFAYKIDIPLWSFLAGGSLVMIIAIGTVSIQTSRAAIMNPVKSLRTE